MIDYLLNNIGKILIFENILDQKLQDDIEKTMLGFEFDWYYHTVSIENYQNEKNIKKYDFDDFIKNNSCEKPMLVHSFISDKNPVEIKSRYMNILENILSNFVQKTNSNLYFKNRKILRAKSNLYFNYSNVSENNFAGVHKDYDIPHYVLLYYVNNSDGDTVFFENNKIIKNVTPKKGTIVFFDGNILHAAKYPKKYDKRCIINIDIDNTNI